MLLTLDSSSLTNQSSQDFTVYFASPLNVRKGIHEIALVRANLWYSYYNISSAMGNNIIAYTNNSSQTRTVTFPDGNYTLTAINTYLESVMLANGDYTLTSGIYTYYISILPDYTTLKVQITLSNTYTIDLTRSTFNTLLGWNQAVYNFTGSQEGTSSANINNNINSLLIHCDIVGSSYQNNILSDVLYTFVPNVPPGSNISVEASPALIYLPLRIPDLIQKIRMYLTDQQNNIINLNSQPVTYLLHLRKQKLLPPTLLNI